MEASVSPGVVEALADRFGAVVPAGAGAWSTAFSFLHDGEQRVVRVGEHVSDFRLDAEMAGYASPHLPIPLVLELSRLDPPHDHLHLCVSTFAPGSPLEQTPMYAWPKLVPQIADLLEALRSIAPPPLAAVPTWPTVLLDRSDTAGRLRGWREKLQSRPDQSEAHRAAMARLGELCDRPSVAAVTPTLIHCDLINRNVHVDNGRITGVFDWGCRRWGDHLYDLAWFEFWAPWFPELDFSLLRTELRRRWGHGPDPDRMAACLLHIGADHLVYNAATGNREDGRMLIQRIVSLGLLD